MYPCPACQGQIIGMDTIYTQGVCMFCQHCGARPDRVSVTRDMAHADIEALAKASWNEWAETNNPPQDLRFSA